MYCSVTCREVQVQVWEAFSVVVTTVNAILVLSEHSQRDCKHGLKGSQKSRGKEEQQVDWTSVALGIWEKTSQRMSSEWWNLKQLQSVTTVGQLTKSYSSSSRHCSPYQFALLIIVLLVTKHWSSFWSSDLVAQSLLSHYLHLLAVKS